MASTDFLIKEAEKVIKLDGTIKNVELSRLTKPGDNYLSLILKADFEIEKKDGSTKTVNAVAKTLPLGQKTDMFNFLGHCMVNEIRWYSEIAPLIEEFAKENKIEIDFFPEYLGSRLSLDSTKLKPDNDAVLFMENLALKGYKTADRYKGFDLITAKAILRRLATFHALPIAIKRTKPENFKILKDLIDQGRLAPPDNSGPDLNSSSASDVSKKEPNIDPPGSEGMKDLLWSELQKIPELTPYLSGLEPLMENPMNPINSHRMADEPWNTLIHNDFWVNNVMVDRRQEGNEPLVKMVDFQLYTYCSYAKDLVCFLLNSINNDVIKKSMDELLRFYYDIFTSVLRQTSANVELSYEDYLKEIKTTASCQISGVIYGTTLIFAEKGTVLDTAVEDFNPFKEFPDMIKRMSQKQKEKIVVIATESAKRGWI